VAEHGSWNRPNKIGYRVVSVVLNDNDDVIEHNVFVDGWIIKETNSFGGRPVDIAVLNDGSILISEDNPGAVIRVYYDDSTPTTTDDTIVTDVTDDTDVSHVIDDTVVTEVEDLSSAPLMFSIKTVVYIMFVFCIFC